MICPHTVYDMAAISLWRGALIVWRDQRGNAGLSRATPKRGTPEYNEVLKIMRDIEPKGDKPTVLLHWVPKK